MIIRSMIISSYIYDQRLTYICRVILFQYHTTNVDQHPSTLSNLLPLITSMDDNISFILLIFGPHNLLLTIPNKSYIMLHIYLHIFVPIYRPMYVYDLCTYLSTYFAYKNHIHTYPAAR
jgi:hypothetical protein